MYARVHAWGRNFSAPAACLRLSVSASPCMRSLRCSALRLPSAAFGTQYNPHSTSDVRRGALTGACSDVTAAAQRSTECAGRAESSMAGRTRRARSMAGGARRAALSASVVWASWMHMCIHDMQGVHARAWHTHTLSASVAWVSFAVRPERHSLSAVSSSPT